MEWSDIRVVLGRTSDFSDLMYHCRSYALVLISKHGQQNILRMGKEAVLLYTFEQYSQQVTSQINFFNQLNFFEDQLWSIKNGALFFD